jgi:hypothetical protein
MISTKKINVSLFQQLLLFLNIFIDKFLNICKKRNKELKMIFKKGEELLEEEMDILRIIKTIRMLKNEDESKYIIDLDDDPSIIF